MTVNTLKSQIQAKTLKKYYVFTGTEWRVQQIYLEQISKFMPVVYNESFFDVYCKATRKSFIQKSVCYVVWDDKDLLTDEKLWSKLDQILGNNVLVHKVTAIDKRTKFYKHYKDEIIDFEPLPDGILKKYIQKEIALSDKSCQKLIDICEHDYGRILLEIDKIKRYVDIDKCR